MLSDSTLLNEARAQPLGGPIQSAITYEKIPTHIYSCMNPTTNFPFAV